MDGMKQSMKDAKVMSSCNRTYRLRFIALFIVFIGLILLSICVGRYAVSLKDAAAIIRADFLYRIHDLQIWMNDHFHTSFGVGGVLPEATWTKGADNVFLRIRLPRIFAALLVGCALSVAGAVYQGMFRNPMVSPDILGASTGAGFGAAVAILLGANYLMITASSFCFGLLAVTAAYLASRFGKFNEILAMILAGMIVSSLFSAGTSFVKLVADTQEQLPAITYWLMGSLSSIKGRDVRFILIPIAIGVLPLFILRWRLNLLTVEEETAKTMGINTRLMRIVVVFCATLLTAASVSVSGMIGWVGLVIPHFARMLFGFDYRRLIPATALFGAAFLLAVDDIARVTTTGELPLGILTSFVGAPIFFYLLVTGKGRYA